MSRSSPHFTVETYNSAHQNLWNQFVARAKNATFLFHRDFMEYHSHRFKDASLLVFKDKKLIAILPANREDTTVYSHQGLTYGGLVLSNKTKMEDATAAFKVLLQFLEQEGATTLQLKLLPRIYNSLPADEINYLLFLAEAKQFRMDVSATIKTDSALKIQKNRMEGVKKAEKHGLWIEAEQKFNPFWNQILIPNLEKRHDAKPVHSLKEIEQLAAAFPEKIVQFNVMKETEIVAGATMFITPQVAHVQYISANEEKQQLGSLDFLFHHLITSTYREKEYFNFGISNVNHGKNINKGLQYWKECFGARSIVHEFYEVDTANHTKLDSVFV
ncbi:GNAT family N-acetyltransferase [Marinirhabdus gelatinilytica]|uniref:Acetyltransferase (GNAT) family protein n=1 Tax=Marinirhabdus gelatinilytica TaxID=1703343 RepID=A0A370Q595_9FLAO|nr:GNAT family N-acetyltransferase [Marinirhabdus gelatinilytica]RDK83240.1 acetyltransferase (GNAT) family protein [Marinirhabdus gelatinilytica]